MSCNNENFLETSISSDLALKVIQYLNVIDSGRLAGVSQRYYYLVHQYRRLRGPELVATSTSPDDSSASMRSVVEDCKQEIQTQPNLLLHFSVKSPQIIPKALSFGTQAVCLGVVSPHEIQVCQPDQEGLQKQLNDESEDALMAMNFPGATVLPFSIRGTASALDLNFLEHRLKYHNKSGDDKFWKALILYSTGGSADQVIVRMQELMPNAVIVGGVCSEGHVSVPKFSKEELGSMSIKHLRLSEKYSPVALPKHGLEKSELVDQTFDALNSKECRSRELIGMDAIFGVFLGGDVPIRSVVSRGVHSALNKNGPPQPFSDLVIHETEFSNPGTEDYLFGSDGPPVHLITKIKDKTSDLVYSPLELFNRYTSDNLHHSQYLGLRRKGRDGFELSEMNNLAMQLDTFVVVTDGSKASEESLEGAEMDFFTFSGNACMEDMDRTMSMLREQTEGEEILGALMYTCCGRGPSPGLIPERMSDAKRFANVFPDVPCLGFYANGEFGPLALAGKENVFQSGRSMHQGFTAVFALFIVPVKDGLDYYNLDDSANNVRKFIREQLHPN